jgi:hypothetical protein
MNNTCISWDMDNHEILHIKKLLCSSDHFIKCLCFAHKGIEYNHSKYYIFLSPVVSMSFASPLIWSWQKTFSYTSHVQIFLSSCSCIKRLLGLTGKFFLFCLVLSFLPFFPPSFLSIFKSSGLPEHVHLHQQCCENIQSHPLHSFSVSLWQKRKTKMF